MLKQLLEQNIGILHRTVTSKENFTSLPELDRHSNNS
jgi:hypothetical protein